MKSPMFGLGLLLLAGSGCASLYEHKAPTTFRNPPINTTGAYPNWRWIGVKSDVNASCPEVPGWKQRQLFRFGARRNTCGGSSGLDKVSEELDRFCIFERGKGARPLPPAASLGLSSLEPDAVAMTPAVQVPGTSGRLGNGMSGLLETHFVQQMGGGPSYRPGSAEVKPTVRLAFLDSEPTRERINGRMGLLEHGYFLSLLGAKLAGPGVKITSQLALPIVRFDADDPDKSPRDLKKGGFVGSFVDLAEAIQREVATWESEDKGKGLRLVLNLSVGWDGERFGGLSEKRVCDLPAGPRAVYLALEFANRQGALIFAAAGNSHSGPHATGGPLLPAAWEKGNLEESACGARLGRPLLYAVGGLQGNDTPIANARRGGMPELAAYADHVALTDSKGTRTSTYTGTSVATAVVASIASGLWHRLGPDPDAKDVVRQLPGVPLKYSPDFRWRSAEQEGMVRRITLCDGSDAGWKCPESSLPSWPAVPKEPVRAPGRFEAIASHDACGGGPYYSVSGAISRPEEICPDRYFNDFRSESWLVPQPEFDPCPDCGVRQARQLLAGSSGDAVLNVEISKEWFTAAVQDRSELKSGTLELEQISGSGVVTRSYVFPAPSNSDPVAINLDGSQGSGLPIRANISWLVVQGTRTYSINSPVLIYK